MCPKVLYACLSYAESGFQSPCLLLTKLSTTVTVEELLELVDYLGISDRVTHVQNIEQAAKKQD
jgi:hypothetical protein